MGLLYDCCGQAETCEGGGISSGEGLFDRELMNLPQELRWREWMGRIETVSLSIGRASTFNRSECEWPHLDSWMVRHATWSTEVVRRSIRPKNLDKAV